MIDALRADGPWPAYADKLMLFGRFVGSWDVEATYFGADGEPTESHRGEWHFGWVLQGHAIQDVLLSPRHDEPDTGSFEYGTTIRLYDPRIDAWRVFWIGSVSGSCVSLIARQDGDAIVLEGPARDGGLHRWTFSEIGDDSFRWRGYRSGDERRTWPLEEEMLVRRRRPASQG
ncbi:MAG: hypothetical protein ACXVYM_01525 [Gaiellaceae bacterium]